MKFFDRHQREMYKNWLVEEMSDYFPKSPQRKQNSFLNEIECEKSAGAAILEEYLEVNVKYLFEQNFQDNSDDDGFFVEIDKDEMELIKMEVDAYLNEPLQNIDCFKYWSTNLEKWPKLCELFK